MIDPAAMPPLDSRYRLRTFGTFSLLGPGDETILGTHGHQHRRLALLSVLAAAGSSGRSRDHLLLLFWPDATQARARHSLEQLLYAIRNSVNEDVFAGVNPVRLNPEVITSDLEAFSDALERGDFESAVREYRGPFLDGFYLSDSPEFEQWLDSERARLARSHTTALERLAQDADAANDHAAAVRWWRKLVEADSVSSKNASGLIRALMNAGDHAAALRHADEYQKVVGRELGTGVGPGVSDLIAEVRARSKTVAPERKEEVVEARRPIADTPPAAVDEEPDKSVPREPLTRRSVRPPLFAAIGIAIALMVAAIAWPRAGTGTNERNASDTRASIAVLPLANVGGNQAEASFIDGLTEELMAALARIDNLRVMARTSAFAFRNSTIGARAIADSLGVSNVLEGSVQRSGSRLRVQVRLVDGRDGSTRWSETFDRELVDVFGVQSEIATAVARQLDLRLGSGAVQNLRRGSTRNIAAYDLYLRGRDPIHLRSASDSGKLAALGYLKQAVALDPSFAAAYAYMPYWYSSLSRTTDLDSVKTLRRLADSAARIALRLDPTIPESHVASGISQLLGSGSLSGAESAFRRALELGATTRAREHLANVLLWTGRKEEALAENLRAAQDDPLSASAAADAGRSLCFNGRYAEGVARLARLSTVRPPLQRVKQYYGFCHAMNGEWQKAAEFESGADNESGMGFLGYYLARAGDSVGARKVLDRLVERWNMTKRGSVNVAMILAGLGDYDAAFDWMNRSELDHWATRADIMYPIFDRWQRDPRFDQAARRLGVQIR